MMKSSSEIFNDKVNLIYEYNKKSPLFVRMASCEIDNNNLDRAIKILEQGIKLFPAFSAAHLLLGKALALTGNYTSALKSIKTGCDLLHSRKTYNHYLKEIELIKKQRSLFSSSKHSAFVPGEQNVEAEDPGLFSNIKEGPKKPESKSPVDDRLEQLAREISTAKIPAGNQDVKPVEADPIQDEGLIISETLAKIYVAQGEYMEAIRVYEKLKKKEPARAEYYSGKIKELKNQPDF